MVFVKERVKVLCEQLKKQAMQRVDALTEWQSKPGYYDRPEDAAAAAEPYAAFHSLTDHWYGPDQHTWFQTRYTVPAERAGQPLWLNVRTQIEEWDDGKNPQFLAFVDGEIVQGVDMNHRLVPLQRAAEAGRELDIQLQGYTGTLHTEFRLLCDVCVQHPSVWGLYYDLAMPLNALDRLPKDERPRVLIETALTDAVNLIDFRDVYSNAYFDSVQAARELLQKTLYGELAGHDDVIATCIGHTHIDVAWWWTVAQTRGKVARSFATVLEFMEEYPEYRFRSSQPQLYAFLKQRYPELYARVKERVAEGRWEPEGGMWLEADCNLTSGESLVRQFLHGKAFFRDEFGVENRVLWLPDVFGYSGALPQICKRSGIDYFMTTKLSWNQFNKVPYDTLLWRGIDGTEVFTHFISTLGENQDPKQNFFTTYNGYFAPNQIMGGWERYQQKDINNDILISYGYGDGGGGPTRDMLEMGERMEKGVVGIPKVRQAGALQYFTELEDRVRGNKRLPRWVGEFYFEYHRGTYTSMARNKRANRKSELMLMDAELLGVLAERGGLAYPAEKLHALWENVLLNQFHDILPGSSIHEVYEVTKREYEQVAADGAALIAERLARLAGEGDSVVLFNTLGWERDDIVRLGDIARAGDALVDEGGARYPVQATAEGACAYVRGLPPKGYRSYRVQKADAPVRPFLVKGNVLETPFYTVTIDENGNIARLWDKEFGREALRPGCVGNQFRMYEDKPIYYDNWDIDAFYTEKSWNLNDVTALEWRDIGPVSATLHIERAFVHSTLSQEIRFYADSRRIDFETVVDWRESQHLLKVLFPLDLNADEATFDIQFGNVKRKVHQNTSWDKARFESCAHKWMDVSDGGYGVSLLNDCKYGHSVIDGVLGLTCVKSGIEPNPVADQERHVFTYALYPHAGDWRQARTPREAYQLNQPAYALRGQADAFSLASTNRENVVLETVKRAEDGDGVILRVYENQNARTPARLTLGWPIASVRECDLIERNEREIPFVGDGFDFSIEPYQIKTFRVCFAE